MYLYATGGFRKLSEDQGNALAEQICQLSSHANSLLQLELDKWRVLSGICDLLM